MSYYSYIPNYGAECITIKIEWRILNDRATMIINYYMYTHHEAHLKRI